MIWDIKQKHIQYLKSYIKKKKKKISYSPPIFYLFFVENNKIEKKNKDMLMEKEITSSPNM